MTSLAPPDPALADPLRREGLDSLAGVFSYTGGSNLVKDGLGHRRRTLLKLEDAEGRPLLFYLKRYGREPLPARLKRRFTYGPDKSPAVVEAENVRSARSAGIATMEVVAAGQESGLLGAHRSYIIVTAVPGDALSRCGEDFLARHRDNGLAAAFTEQLADLARELHQAGYVHRDFYASHLFLDEQPGGFQLHLIDLARLFKPRWRRFRWRVKDLAQLKFSMPPEWVRGHWGPFLAEYLGASGPSQADRYNRAIDRKVAAMRRRSGRRSPAGTGQLTQ